jgi:mono/diheme cytochrome c family protein
MPLSLEQSSPRFGPGGTFRQWTHLWITGGPRSKPSPICFLAGRSSLGRAMTTFLLILTLIIPTGSGDTLAKENMTPWNRAVGTPKGQLENPYPALASIAKEGHRKYMAAGCNGCHGGGGGGGMAAPLTNPIWIYGDDDDTLFRVIALGTGSLSPGNAFDKLGYRRKGSEAVVGPMPDFGTIIKTDDDLWKIIAWIRSVNCGQQVSGC